MSNRQSHNKQETSPQHSPLRTTSDKIRAGMPKFMRTSSKKNVNNNNNNNNAEQRPSNMTPKKKLWGGMDGSGKRHGGGNSSRSSSHKDDSSSSVQSDEDRSRASGDPNNNKTNNMSNSKRTSVGTIGRNVMTASNVVGMTASNVVRNTVMAPVVAGKAVVQGGVSATHMIGQQATKASSTVLKTGAAVGNTVGNTVAFGGKAVVGGGMAMLEGTTQVVEFGGKTVFKGAKGFGKGIRNTFNLGGMYGTPQAAEKKSKWELGIEIIDSLLEPNSGTFGAMSPEQRKGLAEVKKLLIAGPSGGDKTQYIPRDLIKMKRRTESVASSKRNSSGRASTRLSTNFLLQEFAGVKDTNALLGASMSEFDMSESGHLDETDSDDSDISTPEKKDSITPLQLPGSRRDTAGTIGSLSRSLHNLQKDSDVDIVDFVPTEFKALPRDDKLALFEMLSWENLKKWDFNVFELNRITRRRPLLFVGWAILGSPYAQKAMAKELGLKVEESDKGYTFMDELMIPPHKLCNYLRVIEGDYRASNPYHNAIHAADVVQSLHALIQKSLDEGFMKNCPNIKLFTIILSAVVHDVDHPGKTNAFHTQLRTELAVMYNDKSVLENWHVAHAFARMLDIDLLGSASIHDGQKLRDSAQKIEEKTNCETNILCNATPDQFKIVRNLMIEAVLHTDMTKHFEMVNSAKGLLMQDASEDNTWKVLMFMLHMADISGQAKGDPLFKLWTDRCMDEFFAQGDEEVKLGVPISPNCDRNTTIPAESQVGFIKFVVEPAYVVLGHFIPFVQESVLPIITSNLEHWLEKMEEEDSKSDEEPKKDEINHNGGTLGKDDTEQTDESVDDGPSGEIETNKMPIRSTSGPVVIEC